MDAFNRLEQMQILLVLVLYDKQMVSSLIINWRISCIVCIREISI